MISRRFRLGTRASALARWQADWVAAQLAERGVAVELVPISTRGDADTSTPVAELESQTGSPERGVFTKELQRAMADGRIDLAVHSLKDLPTDPVSGITLAAIAQRGPVGDVLVARDAKSLDELREGAAVGTGSIRRRAQLLHVRPDLKFYDIRGNVDTRLAKLENGEYDAIILAEAGLVRLGLADRITQRLSLSIMLPAVGQGALGIEARTDDTGACAAVAPLGDPNTTAAVTAERSLLAALDGGCLAPVAALGRVRDDGQLQLTAAVLSPDGSVRLDCEHTAHTADAALLGRWAANDLLARGAEPLILAGRS
jgi:hydroxymethylbilane synthase